MKKNFTPGLFIGTKLTIQAQNTGVATGVDNAYY